MGRVLPAVLFFWAAVAAAQPSPSRIEPRGEAVEFHASYFGEGGAGGYHPDPGASGYLNGPLGPGAGLPPASHSEAPRPVVPLPPSAAIGNSGSSAQGGFLPASGGVARKAVAQAMQGAPDRGRYSLWEGLAAPIDVSAAQVRDMTPDQASRLGRRDYDGGSAGGRELNLAEPRGAVAIPTPATGGMGLVAPFRDRSDFGGTSRTGAPASGRAELFVAVDMNFKSGAGELRDAVADLARTAGFRPDLRFPPVAADQAQRKVSVWGWMPAQSLSQALNVPSVARLAVQNGVAPRAPVAQATARMLVGLRLPRGVPPGEVLARATRQLGDSGFRWKRTIGYQRVPGSDQLALVIEAEVPVRSLGRVMAHPDVLKIAPVPAPAVEPAPTLLSESPLRDSVLRRFLAYVLARSPLLLLLTPLLVLATFEDGLLRLALVFVPYQ